MATMARIEMGIGFEDVDVTGLDAMGERELDALPFGVIGMDGEGVTRRYNATEARLAGLRPERVLGRHFFESVAQCMNNFLVAQRFQDEADLDEIVPYVLTLRMKPTRVRLRLLAAHGARHCYVLVER